MGQETEFDGEGVNPRGRRMGAGQGRKPNLFRRRRAIRQRNRIEGKWQLY
jgi:hypothetical protein